MAASVGSFVRAIQHADCRKAHQVYDAANMSKRSFLFTRGPVLSCTVP
jgi:hypothetical protein